MESQGESSANIHIPRVWCEVGGTQVHFGSLSERFTTFGWECGHPDPAHPAFPSNAVYAYAAMACLIAQAVSLDRYRGMAYCGGDRCQVRQAVGLLLAQHEGANLGWSPGRSSVRPMAGASTPRGTRVGALVGDPLNVSSGTTDSDQLATRLGRTVGRATRTSRPLTTAGTAPSMRRSSGAGAGLFMTLRRVPSVNVHFARFDRTGMGNRLHRP